MAKLVRGLVRDDKVQPIVAALEKAGVDGVTVTMAQGRGRHSPMGSFRGHLYRALIPIAVIEVIAPDAAAEDVAQLLLKHAHTGYRGDGHVVILDLDAHYAVRTKWSDAS